MMTSNPTSACLSQDLHCLGGDASFAEQNRCCSKGDLAVSFIESQSRIKGQVAQRPIRAGCKILVEHEVGTVQQILNKSVLGEGQVAG